MRKNLWTSIAFITLASLASAGPKGTVPGRILTNIALMLSVMDSLSAPSN